MVDFEFVECVDYENYHYPVVTIGTQTWMAENLRTTKFSDGTDIMNIESDALWASAQVPSYCWVNNNKEVYEHFGVLYNWFAGGGEKNLCPEGDRGVKQGFTVFITFQSRLSY